MQFMEASVFYGSDKGESFSPFEPRPSLKRCQSLRNAS